MKRRAYFLLLFLLPIATMAQTLKGKVTDENNVALSGAVAQWRGTSVGATTTDEGMFEIPAQGISDRHLILSFIGYKTDTVLILNETFFTHKLTNLRPLDEIIVTDKKNDAYISSLAIPTEVITSGELKKGACCDLAGCFGTNASVQATTTNIVTNSQELRILGLSGVYNQVLIDGMPLIQGLSYTYGISGIPGTLVDNIYVSKGANSVLQGFESISGQINVETKEPDKTDAILLNVYLNSFLETQVNAQYAVKKGKWSNLSAFHMVQPAIKWDKDHDGFLDLPKLTRYEFFNKWKIGNDRDWGWSSHIGFRIVNEQRVGGQINFNPTTDLGTMRSYGQFVSFTQPEIWTKTAYRFNDDHRIVFFGTFLYHNQNSWFGTTHYQAQQYSGYANLQYELRYKEEHTFKAGLSYRHATQDEDISFSADSLHRTYAGDYKKIENIPGIFAENTLNFLDDRLTWIAGVRLDYHSQYGLFFTPRTLLRYEFYKGSTIRASAGTGWRTTNTFSENTNLLASSRNIIFPEPLKPERAVNFGINFTQKFKIHNVEGYFSADYYRTQFQNQIFPDYNVNPTVAVVSNFTGPSISNAVQGELSVKFWKRFDVKLAYNYLNVFRKVSGATEILPFNPAHKILVALSYRPINNSWHIDVNLHWFGVQQLPSTSSNPAEYQRPSQSKPYVLLNVQVTKNWKHFEVYGGCENITNFRQSQPIISWQNPYGPYFDTSSAWGPTRGWEAYMGIRFKWLD